MLASILTGHLGHQNIERVVNLFCLARLYKDTGNEPNEDHVLALATTEMFNNSAPAANYLTEVDARNELVIIAKTLLRANTCRVLGIALPDLVRMLLVIGVAADLDFEAVGTISAAIGIAIIDCITTMNKATLTG